MAVAWAGLASGGVAQAASSTEIARSRALAAGLFEATTDVTVEGGNNTSASPGFTGNGMTYALGGAKVAVGSNGNAPQGNVSKLPLSSLLYPGNHTRIFASAEAGFCSTCSGQLNVGYDSSDRAQISRQVDDMLSRGIRGVIVSYKGLGLLSSVALAQYRREAERRGFDSAGKPLFEFSVAIDQHSFECSDLDTCTAQAEAVLGEVSALYTSSRSFMRTRDGHPVIFWNLGAAEPVFNRIDWKTVKAKAPQKPYFIFDNKPGLTAPPQSDGAFAWPVLDGAFGLTTLGEFYDSALHLTGKPKTIVGAAYKGMNDSITPATRGHLMGQQCGKTWLATFTSINQRFSATRPLEALQVASWDNYAEGSEIETGIDNCLRGLAPTLSRDRLSWSPSFGKDPVDGTQGDESTIHHYAIYLSRHSFELMPLGDVPAGTRSFDLSTLRLPPGNYQLYVKAVGQASIKNRLSEAIPYSYRPHALAQKRRQLNSRAFPGSTKVYARSTQQHPDPVARIQSQ